MEQKDRFLTYSGIICANLLNQRHLCSIFFDLKQLATWVNLEK